MKIFWSGYILALSLVLVSPALGQTIPLRYTWMLPKTVIDATVVYTFDGCKGGVASIKIAPTLLARTLPDPLVGQLKIDTQPLQSFWVDKSIAIQTFANSRILSSVGSSPTGQGAQIIGSILTGVVKLAGLAVGLPGAVEFRSGPPEPVCENEQNEGTGPWIVKRITELKKKIADAQGRLADGELEADQKKDTAAIAAAQTLMTTLQEKISFTVKMTIDPGISRVEVDVDDVNAATPVPEEKERDKYKIDVSGLVASICPSEKQLSDAKWFINVKAIFDKQKTNCLAFPSLKTNIYLDFPNAHSTMYDQPTVPGPYGQTAVNKFDVSSVQYRDVAYIPLLVWRGDRPKAGAVSPKETDAEAPQNSFQMTAPQTMVFGQFGVPQSLTVTTDAFKSLAWEVDFQEDGQVTKATFSSKAWGENIAALFGNAASSANTIASNVTGIPSSQASYKQSVSDDIYQTIRMQTCLTTPTSCPGK